ncbi:MAG: FAD-binding oxidoreductase [Firmicutes bacterium]|nr:FAD-binding oxidoreductase [Bacillota bacterium]
MESVRKLTQEYEGYLRDESRSSGHAEGIAFPVSEAEVCEIMKECFECGVRVTVQGARTGLAAAAVPDGGVILNLSRMNKVLGMRFDGNTYYVTAEPGLTLLELRKMISTKRFDTRGWSGESKDTYARFAKDGEFFFSPDPTEATASIGGMTACNASGARTYKYGPTRPYIEAVTMVLADGRILREKRGGDRAKGLDASFVCEDGSVIDAKLPTLVMPKAKNASGYYVEPDMELIDLLIGSDGSLGVMTSVELRLLPLPSFIWGVSLLFESEEASLDFTLRIQGEEGYGALEFFDSDALDILRAQKKKGAAFAALPDIPPQVTNVIYTEIHAGSEAEALEKLFRLGEVFAEAGGKEENSWVARDGSELDRLIFFRHAIPESVNMLIDQKRKSGLNITKMSSDMSVPDGKLREVMAMYRGTLAEWGLKSAAWGHIGNNHVHFNILPDSEEQCKEAKELFKEWAAWISRNGGAVSAEHGVGKLKADFLTVMYGEEHIDEMRRLKRAFDPKWQLGAGNMFSEKEGI